MKEMQTEMTFIPLDITLCVWVKQVEEGKNNFYNLLSGPSGFSSCCAYSTGWVDAGVDT